METNKKRLIETLTRGRNSAERLQNSIRREEVNVDDCAVSIDDLLTEVLGSFCYGLSILNSSDSGEIPATPYVSLVSSVDQMPEVYSGKKPGPVVKERRGCYKRRRTIDSTIKISGTTEDGYSWRKYGQKEILNSKFPRCYYRCTHKPLHGCKAQKQVQKLEDESNMFHITYIGYHTCPTPNSFSHHELVLDFEDSKTHHNFSNSPSTITNIHTGPSVKQEVDSKAQSADVSSDNVSSANDGRLSSSATIRWNDVLMDDMGSCHVDASIMGFDNEDSCASATSSHAYLNFDFLNNGDLSDINLLDVFS